MVAKTYETPETMANYLISIAAGLRDGKPIPLVLEELLDTVCVWREEFLPNNTDGKRQA